MTEQSKKDLKELVFNVVNESGVENLTEGVALELIAREIRDELRYLIENDTDIHLYVAEKCWDFN